jgi:hypothetical protein
VIAILSALPLGFETLSANRDSQLVQVTLTIDGSKSEGFLNFGVVNSV